MTIPSFSTNHLEAICNILADTSEGLTGSEIGSLLKQLGIEDSAISTKRHRLFDALSRRQQQDRCGNNVVAFLQATLDPVRYVGRQDAYDANRIRLNEVLAFAGYTIRENGRIIPSVTVSTLAEATERAGRLRAELIRRGVHADVLRFCRVEFLQENYFHASYLTVR